MAKTRDRGSGKEPSRQILVTAIVFVGLGVLLLVISVALGSDSPHQAFGNGIRVAAPYFLLAGFGLLVLSVVLHRPRPDEQSPRRHETTMFGKDTTDFAPSLVRSSLDDPTLPVHRGQQAPAMAWSARVFEDIEWRRFEALCESLLAQAGFETRTQSHGTDAGADIWLQAPNTGAPAAVARCKHLGKPVGIEEMREFFGVMASHKLHRGTFATSSPFTPDAQRFAKDNGISFLDGPRLLALISSRTPAQQHSLLAIAYEGEYWRPTCASCGVKMVERPAPDRRGSIWGCIHFPRCQFTLPVRNASSALATPRPKEP
jgi:restriction system protein